MEFGIQSRKIASPEGLQEGIVWVKNKKIEGILPYDAQPAFEVEALENEMLMPGIIDTHVHINEPGRTNWEGFETATKAAAAGGITTLIEMPLNSNPVTTSVLSFEKKQMAAFAKLWVNCGFWGGLVPDHMNDLLPLAKSGVFGFKAFLTPSGIDDFQHVNEKYLMDGMKIISGTNRPLLAHCELDSFHEGLASLDQNPRSYAAYLASRPDAWELDAIQLMIKLCRETGTKVHIVHLSTAQGLDLIDAAKKEGLPITVETCPHYLLFEAESIPDGATQYKCAPPIRSKSNQEKLWEGLKGGIIDFVATDHSPAPPEMKAFDTGNFKTAWGGIAGLQFLLPALWTGMKRRNIEVQNLLKWLCEKPAILAGLDHKKGKILKGFDADMVSWNPEESVATDPASIFHRHKVTPYSNLALVGKVHSTWVEGRKVFEKGKFLGNPTGRVLLK